MLNNFWAMYLPAIAELSARYAKIGPLAAGVNSDNLTTEGLALAKVKQMGAFRADARDALTYQKIHGTLPQVQAQETRADRSDERNRGYLRHGNIAVVPVMGAIEKRASWYSDYFGMCSTLNIQAGVEAAANDPDIDAIVLLCDSPGGSVDGLADCADVIYGARSKKKIAAHVQGMCASAAYHLCSQAHEIWCGRMDLVGSIGTLSVVYDWSKAFDAEGIRTVVLTTGKFKGAGVVGAPVTEDHEREFQRIVDTYFDDFTKAIARGRGMTDASVKQVADGRVFFADEAKSYKLVDGVRTLAETLAAVKGGGNGNDSAGRSTQATKRRLDLMNR